MKKILVLLMVCVLTFSLFVFGCGEEGGGNSGNPGGQTGASLEEEMEYASEALFKLYNAYTICLEATNRIYSAWGYAIYYADRDIDDMLASGSRDQWDDFLLGRFWLRTEGMSDTNKLREAIESVTGTSDGGFWQHFFDNFSYTVAFAQKYSELDSTNSEISNLLESGHDYIQKLTENNKSSTHKDDLIEMYSSILSFYDMVKNPTGNYSTYASTKNEYQNDIMSQYNTLSMYLE